MDLFTDSIEETTDAPRTTPTPPTRPTSAIVADLKAGGQDFEWYPTTDEMLQAVARCCGDIKSLLDIGAGDGRALQRIQAFNQALSDRARERDQYAHHGHISSLYAIEKSPIHIANMPAEISIIGTDFLQQSLIDKDVDGVFCNPPYSQYEEWACKILREAYCKYVFLILPDRWKDSKTIQDALKSRNTTARSIWAGDFSAADRPARARVEILQISIRTNCGNWKRDKQDPFDLWFNEVFPEFDRIKSLKDDDQTDYQKKEDDRKKLRQSIVAGANLIETLADLYRAEMDSLYKNYRSLCSIDPALLKELGIDHEDVKKGLKLKINGTKNKYWSELFDHLNKITSRLTKATRQRMLEKLRGSTNIDFTSDNAYAVVIWAIKNANQYINEQVTTMFRDLSEPESVKNYKSNQKTWEKQCWRYNAEDHSRYTLDYRIVVQRQGGICTEYRRYEGLAERGHDFLGDIGTVASNLGFTNTVKSDTMTCGQWASGGSKEFYCTYEGKRRLLMAVRAYMNGNIHIKFDQDFIKTLNIEASRLLGWIKSPEQAAEEMGYSVAYCRKTFKTNRIFAETDAKKLLTV